MRPRQEIEQELKNIKQLIAHTNRHKQVLEEQRAQMGVMMAPPHVVTGIAAAEEQLESLRYQQQQLEQELALLESPSIFIANWSGVPPQLPAATVVRNHSHLFDFDPRRLPTSEQWQQEILPGIRGLRSEVAQPGLVRLQGSASLSSAFAFGQTFRHLGGWRLAVEQVTKDSSYTWVSSTEPPPHTDPLQFRATASGVQPEQQAGVVIIFAAPQTTPAVMLKEVATAWQESEGFKALLGHNGAAYTPQQARGVLLLSADPAAAGQHLNEHQVATLASTSRRLVNEFIATTEPQTLHLFIAGPRALAAFLGHHWNQLGLPVQCYERLARNSYLPSILFSAEP